MTTYQSRLRGREEVAEGTMAFHLEKPAGFQFKAGQYVDISLINPPETDSQGIIRSFSIASAPYENELLVVTRMRNSAFKRVLAILPLGTEVKLEGPMGSFTLHKNRAKAGVFLAGGIGITPFLSILRQAAEEKLSQRLYLFYSNRHPKDAAFLKDLEILSQRNANCAFIPSMSESGKIYAGLAGRARLYQPRNAVAAHGRPAGTDLLRRGPSRHGCGNARNAHKCRGRGRRYPYGGIRWVLIAACGGDVRFYCATVVQAGFGLTEKVIPTS